MACDVLYFRHARSLTLEQKIEVLTNIVEAGFASLGSRIGSVEERMEEAFAPVAEDIGDIKREMATKDQLFALQTQVTGIETTMRTMQHTKLHARVADLEEKAFGAAGG